MNMTFSIEFYTKVVRPTDWSPHVHCCSS